MDNTGFMSNTNGKESSSSSGNPQLSQSAPFFGSFSLTAPVFLVPSSQSNNINITTTQPKYRQIFSNGQPPNQVANQPLSDSSLRSQAMDLQALSSTLATQQVQKSLPVPLYQGKILNPVAVKPLTVKSVTSKKSKGKSIIKQKPVNKFSPPKLPPQLSSFNFPDLSTNSLAMMDRMDRSRKRSREIRVYTKDISCQTSGWKFMSEIGTIEAMKEKNRNRDRQASKSTIIATLRDVYRRFKQKIEGMNYDSPDSHGFLMDSVVEDFQRWLKQQHGDSKNTCLLCEQTFLNEKAAQQHLVSSCVVLRTIFTETVIGLPQAISQEPDDKSKTDGENREKVSNPGIFQDIFSKSYLHDNSVKGLKGKCMFCGVTVKKKEVSETDMYLDKRHLFDSCIVFKSFLIFHGDSYTLTTSQKVGTSWTFLYYYCLLNYYALNFEYDIHDLRFLQEDKAHYIVQILESITESITHRASDCPLCYSNIKNSIVLKHHISFSLCPFLLKFYKDMRTHVENVWKVPGQVETLRSVSSCFQYFMSFQSTAKPIMIKQSILPDSLAYKLLENAMYFKSLDQSFNLQYYKAPKETAIAIKIEEQQQQWAEEVLQCKSSDVATECPFCFTTFNTERNLLKHIVYISCKSIRPVCQQIYNLLEYCEWDVQNPVAIITQHSCYIIKQAVLRGEFEINLLKEQLTEYVTIVTAKFLNFNLTDRVKSILFESTESSIVEPALNYDENNLFQEFFSWAKRIIKKKNGAMCPLCGQDKGLYNTLVNHLALGACPYLKQFLNVMDEIYQFNHLFRPCPAPSTILISKTRSITFDFVHHIRKVLFLFKGSTKCSSFFDHDEFEAFMINSPQSFSKHANLMSYVIGKESTTCSFCFMDFKSQDHLLLHLQFLRCPTIMCVVDLVKNEWNVCSKGMAKTDKMLEVIKIYSSMFEMDPSTVISSGSMKRYFNENNNIAMLNNFKFLQSWAQSMFTYDSQSTLNICNACNVAAELIERHLWLEEPVENFCPEIKSYLDFHRRMVCKKDNRGEIKASFTVTDLFEIKRFIQRQYSHLHKSSKMDICGKQSIISPSLRKQIRDSINTTLKIYPRYDGSMESFRLMYGTSPSFLANQLAIADKIAVCKICFLCDIMFLTVEDVRYHIATFECCVLQNMLQHVKVQDQIDQDVVKCDLINAYKRTVAYCRELYPNLYEGNLLLVMETVDSQCHSKLYNFIMSKIPRNNPYKCSFCTETFTSMGELYSHYKKVQCLGLKDCFGFIPNKGPSGVKHPFLLAVYKIFLSCYNTFGMRNQAKLKTLLAGVNNLADSYEFWCSNYCDSLVPECPFCEQDLLSVSMIKGHPLNCSKLRESNLEVFRSDRLQDSSFMKQQGLGSCKLTGELPREVTKESEGVPFMQRYRCSQYLGWIPLCLDCATSTSNNSTIDEETCRFLWFRRLVKKDTRLFVFDFESSQTAANVSSWVPSSRNTVLELEVESAKYILRHLLPHFNHLMSFELWELENVPNIRLKHQVKNVRELCDTCTTTLFNIHLFCPRCGYVICMDCYRDRLAGFVSTGLADCSDGSVHNLTSLDTCVTIPPRAVKQMCSAVEAVKDLHCISVIDLPFTRCPSGDAPHDLICHGQVLALKNGNNPDNIALFSKFHQKGNAVVVYGGRDQINSTLWAPESFSKHFGNERELVINTSTLEVHRISLKDFFDGFSDVNERPRNENGDPMVLKLKDWPTSWDFKEKLPQWYDDFMRVIPLKSYTQRTGIFNIARYLPNIYCSPDLGPKMYIAYSNANNPNEGSTVLHIDISDAVNIIMYVGQSQDVVIDYDDNMTTSKSDSSFLKRKVYSLKDICEDTDDKQLERIRKDRCKVGALWHIYHPNDIDKIRHFIHKVLNESGQTLPPGHDPIHDQAMYLDKNMRKRLFQEYGVRGWPIVQCEGESVFIPAGAPHQVRNLQSCIKIAEDYVSPERVSFCLKHTQEIRHLSKQHSNQEDKLQIKNLIYHGVKECVSVLQNHLPTKDLCTCKPSEMCSTSTQITTPLPGDARDITIERLQAEMETLRKNSAMEKKNFKDQLLSKEADYNKARKCYELEKQTTKTLKSKLTKTMKRHEQTRLAMQEQASQNFDFVKVLPVSYQTSFSSRSHEIQKPEARVQELRKPEARHPQHRTVETRHAEHSKRSEPRQYDAQSSDNLHEAASSSHADLKRSQFSKFEPADFNRPSTSHGSSSMPSSSSSRDPRLKSKMVESEPEVANAPVWGPSRQLNNRPSTVVPKSAFQGVQHAVQDLRTKKPPPQKVRKTPETPEPMDTNQDSCSPSPAGIFGPKSNLEMLSAVSAVQPRSYPTNRVYDQGASNSETDSNEEALNPQYAGNFAPTPPASKAAVIPGPFSSPSVSPGFNPKSLNLQISSPKQPAIFSKQPNQKKTTYNKAKEELAGKPRQGQFSNKPTALSEIFPIQPSFSSSSLPKQPLPRKDIKPELRTPPSERVNPPTFAPHLASYLPDMLTRSNCAPDRTAWNTGPRKTVASPVTPTISPAVTTNTVVTSPATPPPNRLNISQQPTAFSTPPIGRNQNLSVAPKNEPHQQSSCALQSAAQTIHGMTGNPLLRAPNSFNLDVRRAALPVMSGTAQPDGVRARSKSNESYASLSSSSPDIVVPQKVDAVNSSMSQGGDKSLEAVSNGPAISTGTANPNALSRDPRLARRQSGETSSDIVKHQDETITSSNEATNAGAQSGSKSATLERNFSDSEVRGSAVRNEANVTSEAKVTSTTTSSTNNAMTEEQKRLYYHPEPEKLVIFDETLLTRLKKKRAQGSLERAAAVVETSSSGLVVSENTASSSRIVNPLLRKKAAPVPTSPPKVSRKPHLAHTVDAILKSDKIPPQHISPTTEPAAPTFDASTAVSRYEEIVNPASVLVALSGIARSNKRSREPSGNSVSSIGNMPVLSPISPASTPPLNTGEGAPPPLPPGSPPPLPSGSPPRLPPGSPPQTPPPDISPPATSTTPRPVLLPPPGSDPSVPPVLLPPPQQTTQPILLPPPGEDVTTPPILLPPPGSDPGPHPHSEDVRTPTEQLENVTSDRVNFSRKRKCSKSSNFRKSNRDSGTEQDNQMTPSCSSHIYQTQNECVLNSDCKSDSKSNEPREHQKRSRRPSEKGKQAAESSKSKKKHEEKAKNRVQNKHGLVDTSSPKKEHRSKSSDSESKRSSMESISVSGSTNRERKRRTPSPTDAEQGHRKRSGSSSSSKNKSKRRSKSSSKRDDVDLHRSASPAQQCSRDTSDTYSRDSDRGYSSREVSHRRSSTDSRATEKRRSDESLSARRSRTRSRSTSSERVVRYQERQSPVFTRTVSIGNLSRNCQNETVGHKRKSKRRK